MWCQMTEFVPWEMVALAELKPHPRNYRKHPEDQLEHLCESIRANGVYRNIAIARDSTILAGHGVAKACAKLGMATIPVLRLDLDPGDPKALKLLAGDNEISNLAVIDDRALSDMLKEIGEIDIEGLLGTGYDDMMLANLAMVTRPQSEIEDFNEAAEWVGLPEYEPVVDTIKVVVSLRSQEDRQAFLALVGAKKHTDKTKSVWWPHRDNDDLNSVRFEDKSRG